jgi:glycosyltransferase involved in cell wall biosynthesis
MMQASVIIPTYNRAKYLPLCLEAVASQRSDPQIFEIIVVDNNSTDNTPEIVQNFSQSHPQLIVRYICEIAQGVSYARNRGVEHARGEIICFLDDDSPPSPDWLTEILIGFEDPSIGCVGGPSILDYQGQQIPSWLSGDLQAHLSAYGLPYTEPTQVTYWEHFPLSCNMAIRKNVFRDLGRFRVDLDRSGGQVLAAGDTEMASRIHKAGLKVVYLPNATVRHIVPKERLKKSHIYRICRGLAISHILLTTDPRPHMILRWFASDLWYATRMFFRLALSLVQKKPLWFDDYIRLWTVSMRLPIRLKMVFLERGLQNER